MRLSSVSILEIRDVFVIPEIRDGNFIFVIPRFEMPLRLQICETRERCEFQICDSNDIASNLNSDERERERECVLILKLIKVVNEGFR